MQEAEEEVDRSRIRPVNVIENEDQGLGGSQPFEQLTNGAVGPVTLVLKAHGGATAEAGQRREHLGELGADLLVEGVQTPRFDALDVLVERVDEDPEGEIAFEVCARAGQDDVTARVSAGGELGQQARLADPGGPDDLDRPRTALSERVERLVQLFERWAAPYEVVGELINRRPRRDYTPAGAAEGAA